MPRRKYLAWPLAQMVFWNSVRLPQSELVPVPVPAPALVPALVPVSAPVLVPALALVLALMLEPVP